MDRLAPAENDRHSYVHNGQVVYQWDQTLRYAQFRALLVSIPPETLFNPNSPLSPPQRRQHLHPGAPRCPG